ncbi:MAG: lactoylglutathione lyase [Planctomycetaceae bacterium]|nr:MAG: lactoylglutathione lyase [Planctomycetaceae bacterium]
MTNPAFHVKHLDHVTIVVRDLARTRWFYVEVLGMQEVARPAFSFAGQWFRAGPTLIHTILEHEQSGPAGQGASLTSRGHHVAFMVEDARAWETYLRQHGCGLLGPAKQRPDGAWQLFVQDPDGHLIELCSGP